MEEIINYLRSSGRLIAQEGGYLHTYCPKCQTDGAERGLAAMFVINEKTGEGDCRGNCQILIKSEDMKAFLNIPEIGLKKRANIVADDLKLSSLKELMGTPFTEPKWLVDHLVPEEGIVALSANPAVGKTFFTLLLAQAIAEGEPFLGQFSTKKGSVLIVDEENRLNVLRPRFEILKFEEKSEVYWLLGKGFMIDQEGSASALIEKAKNINASLVIFDSLVRIHRADENDARSMSRVFSHMQELTKAGLSVLFTHHNRKDGEGTTSNPAQKMRGSSDILAMPDIHLSMKIANDEGDILVEQTKNRHEEPIKPFGIKKLKEGEYLRFVYDGDADPSERNIEEAMQNIYALLGSEDTELNQSQITAKLKKLFTGSLIRKALSRMEKEERLLYRKGQHNRHLYSINPEAPVF